MEHFPPVVHDWANKGPGMSSHVYATGHIKHPVATYLAPEMALDPDRA